MPDEHNVQPWRTVREVLSRWDIPEDPSRNHIFHRHTRSIVERIRGTPPGKGVFEYRQTWVRLFADRPAPTVMGAHGGVFVHPWHDRCASPRELAALQDFPDDYVFCGSKSSIWRQVGNAVPVGLGRAVGEACLDMLSEPEASGRVLAPSNRIVLTFRDAVGDLPEEAGQDGEVVKYSTEPQNDFQRRMRDGAAVVTEHVAPRHGSRMVAMMRHIPEGKSAQAPEVRDKIPEHLRPGRSFLGSYHRIQWDRPAPTITGNSGAASSGNCIHPSEPRSFTIREAARCQSFPDTYRFVGTPGQIRLQIGNAVPPLLAEALGRALLRHLADGAAGEQELGVGSANHQGNGRRTMVATPTALIPSTCPAPAIAPWYERDGITIYNCDAHVGLRTLASTSVNCVVTSPPYFRLRDYGIDGQLGLEDTVEEYIQSLVEVFREVRRVMTPDGTLWVNLGDKYANSNRAGDKVFGNPEFNANRPCRALTKTPGCRIPKGFKSKELMLIPARFAIAMKNDGWLLRSDIIWAKPNPTPESVKDRMTRTHEHIFMFTKREKYYFNASANQEPAVSKPHAHGKGKESALTTTIRSAVSDAARREPSRVWSPSGSRNRRDVWVIATRPYKGAHFATFPEKLVEYCVKPGCPEGGTLLDMFGGSGTVGAAAKRLGMKAILIELNPEYCKLARQRIERTKRDQPQASVGGNIFTSTPASSSGSQFN